MKKLFGALVISVIVCLAAASAFAVTSLNQTANVTVNSILSIEFATATETTFGGGAIPWTSIDPTSSLVYPTGGHVTDKADTGVKCVSNATTSWYLKMNVSGGNLPANKVKFYMGQPTVGGAATNGTLAYPTPGTEQDWPVLPATATTVYTSGNDTNNAPTGTFVGVSYALNPSGLVNGTSYSSTITYTITTTP